MSKVDLTFHRLALVNAQRASSWHRGFPNRADPWSGADWSNAMQGEAGEAGNVVKKLRRIETGLLSQRDRSTESQLVEKLGAELADTLIYADLLATYYGIDLGAALVAKFNAVSEAEGLEQRL